MRGVPSLHLGCASNANGRMTLLLRSGKSTYGSGPKLCDYQRQRGGCARQINQVIAALRSTNSGGVEPAATAPGMLWLDTSTTPPTLKLRNLADAAFEPLLDGGEY